MRLLRFFHLFFIFPLSLYFLSYNFLYHKIYSLFLSLHPKDKTLAHLPLSVGNHHRVVLHHLVCIVFRIVFKGVLWAHLGLGLRCNDVRCTQHTIKTNWWFLSSKIPMFISSQVTYTSQVTYKMENMGCCNNTFLLGFLLKPWNWMTMMAIILSDKKNGKKKGKKLCNLFREKLRQTC